MNQFGVSTNEAVAHDPRFESSRLALTAGLSGGCIQGGCDGQTLVVTEGIRIDPDSQADAIALVCSSRLRQLTALVKKDLAACYEFAGLEGGGVPDGINS